MLLVQSGENQTSTPESVPPPLEARFRLNVLPTIVCDLSRLLTCRPTHERRRSVCTHTLQIPTIGNNVNENLSLTCPIKVAPAWRQTVMAQCLRPIRNASV
jgi:hypothetical protein